MIKYTSLFVAVALTTSSSLQSMFKITNVTNHQKICKDPEQKKRLIKIYSEFCRQRFHEAASFAGGVTIGFVTGNIMESKGLLRKYPYPNLLVGVTLLSWLFPAYTLSKYHRAQEGDFSYLDRDVLKQLGNPREVEGSKADCWYWYEHPEHYRKGLFGYKKEWDKCHCWLNVSKIDDIEKALSGKYKTRYLGNSSLISTCSYPKCR